MSIDSIGNYLTIIRNGFVLGKRTVEAPFSKINFALAEILKEEGFIKDYKVIEQNAHIKSILISLKYVDGESVIHELKRLSRPSRRYYAGSKNIRPVRGNLGISILSTNKGLMTDKKAKEISVGGEIICSVW
jgi:small subunit ribosomal protein S8